MKHASSAALAAPSVATLLGIEGAAALVYFRNFAGMIKVSAETDEIPGLEDPVSTASAGQQDVFTFDFRTRNRRPPRDPVNALLSLAYSLLARDCTVAALAVGFDPYVGLYHQPRFGRPALALDVMEEALAADPVADHRMRVEHCCYVTPPILERIRRLGVVDSSATGFMYDLGDGYIANRGQEAMRWMWPHRSLIDAGIPAPGHSDAMVCQANPFVAMWSMVNRRSDSGGDLDIREAITVDEALRAYTILGAWSGREEAIKGSLEVGKLADIAVLDRDPYAIDPMELRDVGVDMTFVDGRMVHGG